MRASSPDLGGRVACACLLAFVGMAALLTLLLGRLIPAVAGTADPRWPDGIVNVYVDSDIPDTVITAAERWTESGAAVQVRVVGTSGTRTSWCGSTTSAC